MVPPRILFVCTGNICRSPTAAGVFLHRAAEAALEVIADSAGTSAEEAGNPTDHRARQVAAARGYELPPRIGRQVRHDDFKRFDRILAATRLHLRALEQRRPSDGTARLELMMAYAPEGGSLDIPDPWYGGWQDYEHALDLIEAAVNGLVMDLLGHR